MNYRINADKTAAVSNKLFWLDMDTCPKGVKVLALSKYGVARLDVYSGQADLVGWFPLPRVRKQN